jgi:hypothetical protein
MQMNMRDSLTLHLQIKVKEQHIYQLIDQIICISAANSNIYIWVIKT